MPEGLPHPQRLIYIAPAPLFAVWPYYAWVRPKQAPQLFPEARGMGGYALPVCWAEA